MPGAVKVVVVGAGPSGIYTADELTKLGYQVDVLDRLPCPYGLLRYGVAPDHPKMKSLEVTFRKVLERPTVRFLGGVELGEVELGAAVTVDDLRAHYDAVVYATGAAADRKLGVPGEHLDGSVSATDFVSWYSGHPDATPLRLAPDTRAAVVVGMGNVALDVARMLAKDAAQLRATDVPDEVLERLDRSAVTDIHILGRRGPAHARFTTKELRELGELANVEVLVDAAELELDEAGRHALAEDPTLQRNHAVFVDWSTRERQGCPRRIHFHFFRSPRRLLGERRVSGVELERNVVDGQGKARGTGELAVIQAQLVLRSIGYRGVPLAGVPFDERLGIIPNGRGRVLRDGVVAAAEYAVGWAKRGPTGVIGTNKLDAKETVARLAEDLAARGRRERHGADLAARLAVRGRRVVSWPGWQAIEAAEHENGIRAGRGRTKITDWDQLWRTALAATQDESVRHESAMSTPGRGERDR